MGVKTGIVVDCLDYLELIVEKTLFRFVDWARALDTRPIREKKHDV